MDPLNGRMKQKWGEVQNQERQDEKEQCILMNGRRWS